MLVLTRRLNESIIIGDNVEIKILQIRGSGDQAVIRVGITAPKQVTVLRKEVYEEVVAANQQAMHVEVSLPSELLEAVKEAGKMPVTPPPPKTEE